MSDGMDVARWSESKDDERTVDSNSELNGGLTGNVYSGKDMLMAFKHGRAFKPLDVDGDVDYTTTENKHKPFHEWLRSYEKTDS